MIKPVDAGQPLDRDIYNRIKFVLNEELPTLYTFDLVDFKKVDDDFKKIALKNTEPILYIDERK